MPLTALDKRVPLGATDMDAATLETIALASPKVVAAMAGRTPLRVIHAGGGKLVNIVVRD